MLADVRTPLYQQVHAVLTAPNHNSRQLTVRTLCCACNADLHVCSEPFATSACAPILVCTREAFYCQVSPCGQLYSLVATYCLQLPEQQVAIPILTMESWPVQNLLRQLQLLLICRHRQEKDWLLCSDLSIKS